MGDSISRLNSLLITLTQLEWVEKKVETLSDMMKAFCGVRLRMP